MTFARQSLGSLLALVFGVAVSILLPRILGAEARGEYQLAVKLAGLVLAVAQWGIPEVLLQLSADRRSSTAALLGTSLTLGVFGAALTAIVLVVLTPALSDNLLRGVEPVLMWIALGGSLASVVGLLARRFIQLDGRIVTYNVLDVGRTLLFLICIAVGAVLVPRDALGPTVAWLVGEIALGVAALWFTLRHVSPLAAPRGDLALELSRAGAPIQLGLLAMFVGSEGGSFVLNASLPLAAVGIYSVGLSVARLVLQVSVALRTALQPRLVAAERDSAEITARVTRHGLVWMLLVACGLAIGSPLAPLIFTREFAEVTPVLNLLLPGMVAYGVWQLLASHLLRLGQRSFLAVNAWLFAVLSIGLQAAGAQVFGIFGAAAGLSLAYVVATAVVLVVFLRSTHQPLRELLPAARDLDFYVRLLQPRPKTVATRP